jgi:hypothetical protein
VTSPSAVPPNVEELAADLDRLARICTLGEYRRAHFRTLYRLTRVAAIAETEGLAASLEAALLQAIDGISDLRHREAARAIFGLDGRWVHLRRRQALAASKLGIGYDAYRRRRLGHPSRYDDTVSELARSLHRLDHLPSPLLDARLVVGPVRKDGSTCWLALQLPVCVYEELTELAAVRGISLGELFRRGLLVEARRRTITASETRTSAACR